MARKDGRPQGACSRQTQGLTRKDKKGKGEGHKGWPHARNDGLHGVGHGENIAIEANALRSANMERTTRTRLHNMACTTSDTDTTIPMLLSAWALRQDPNGSVIRHARHAG